MAGPTIKGFETEACLHSGANSEVYKARDTKSGQVVAIKHISEEKLKSQKLFRHIKNEYHVGSVLRRNKGGHPPQGGITLVHSLRIHRRWLQPVAYDMIMEYIPGDNLDELKGFEIREIATLYYRAAKALRFMHFKGYAHADVKPSNIVVTHDLGVKLVDFGLSCKMDTQFSSIRGTPEYMAPEQVECRRINAMTDVYNLGATMYKLLTGRFVPSVMASPGAQGEALFLTDKKGQPIPVREINPNVPPALAKVVTKSCQRKKRHRLPSMTAVINALEAVYPNLARDS